MDRPRAGLPAQHPLLPGRWATRLTRRALSLLPATALLPRPARSQPAARTLRFAIEAEPTSMDPHFHAFGPNIALSLHVFGTLVRKDAKMRLHPGLAESWRVVDDTTWEFRLRPGVRFHDGSPLTAEDVAFSVRRIPTVPNSPGLFTIFTGQITAVETPDERTVRLRTAEPYPLMPNQMTEVMIVSRRAAATARSEDFNSGAAMVGTGPFRFVEWRRGDRVLLRRDPDYWGDAPAWDAVDFRRITNPTARLAALQAGDVDIIENPPSAEVERLGRDPRLRVSRETSFRIIYLHFDHKRETGSPGVRAPGGINPFRDRRVRQAVSLAINRQLIVDRIMSGLAVPAGQTLTPGLPGYEPSLAAPRSNPERARVLLAEAGFPNGFEVTLATPNDRYVNDDKIAEAVAQMLSRVGIRVRVDAMPGSVFFARRGRREFSLFLAGLGSGSGEGSHSLRALMATPDAASGRGASNQGDYSNPALDALLDEAMRTMDDGRREGLLRRAIAVAMEDHAVIPLHWEVSAWASRADIAYEARMDQYSVATHARPLS